MAVSPARAAAFDILLRVERDQSYASELLHSSRLAKLSSCDHGLATELVMGILRWRSLLDQRLASASSQRLDRLDLEVLTALRLGLYQLQFLSRVPARAAIFESVELVKAARKRSAAPFVNAILRKTEKSTAESALEAMKHCPDAAHLASCSAHPEWLVARWVERYGLGTARAICAYDQTVSTTAIHIHDDKFEKELIEAGVQLSPGALLSSARRVNVERRASHEPALSAVEGSSRAGTPGSPQNLGVSIQDEASQLVALLAGHGEKILDCCAAPGSKTTLLAKRNPRARVFASELHPHRARLLRHLVSLPNVHTVAADARQLPFASGFDRILADVPCSGTGTLARNPEIKWRLNLADLADLQGRQIAILKSALGQLAAGGRLVYSTCSLEREENEAVVEAALEAGAGFARIDCRVELEQLKRSNELRWDDVGSLLAGPYLRTIPGQHPCDGFFAAIVERT
jgi:16S rRNA (cytosine967-C5)-methyltransferase